MVKINVIESLIAIIVLAYIINFTSATSGDGDLGDDCKPDGTCNGSLVCAQHKYTGVSVSGAFVDKFTFTCVLK